jgi:hypothetical protein
MIKAGVIFFEALPVGDIDHDAVIDDLRSYLMDSGASRAEPVRLATPDPGQRPADFLTWATLGVSLVGTAAQVVDLIRGWLSERRADGVVSVKVTIDGDVAEVFAVATHSEDQRLDDFIRRHGG